MSFRPERWFNSEEPYQSLREKVGTSHGDYNVLLKYPAWEGSLAAMARLLTVTDTEAMMGSTVSRLSGLGPELRRFQQVPGVRAWLQLPAFQTLPAEVQARMHFYLGGDAARALAVLEAPAGKLPSEYAIDVLGAALEVDPGAPLVESLRKRYADDGDLLVVWLIDTKRAVPAVVFPSHAYAKLVGRKNALSIIRILASLGRNAQPALGQLRSPLALSSVTGESSMKAALSLLGAIDRIEWESR